VVACLAKKSFFFRTTEIKETLIKFTRARRDALKAQPSAAKAACVAGSIGMAEATPFQGSPLNDLIGVI
jgi:hypothetical protein